MDQLEAAGVARAAVLEIRDWLNELDRACASLSDGGAVVADDIDFNRGFAIFAGHARTARLLHCPADDGRRLFGIAFRA